MDLTTSYLGLRLKSPLMPGASPLVNDLSTVLALEDAGASAIVLHSLFEEQMAAARDLDGPAESHAEARSYFPAPADYAVGPEEYLDLVITGGDAGTGVTGADLDVTSTALTMNASTIGASGDELDTQVGALTATATAVGGSVFIDEQDAITLSSVHADTSGGVINIQRGTGLMTATSVTAGDAAAGGGGQITLVSGGAMTVSSVISRSNNVSDLVVLTASCGAMTDGDAGTAIGGGDLDVTSTTATLTGQSIGRRLRAAAPQRRSR